MKLRKRELATVLAALRFYQKEDLDNEPDINDIATDGWTLDALTVAEIDSLCEELNCQPTRNCRLADRTEKEFEVMELAREKLARHFDRNDFTVYSDTEIDLSPDGGAWIDVGVWVPLADDDDQAEDTEDLTATSALLPGVTSR
jgi:hypothetical protein